MLAGDGQMTAACDRGIKVIAGLLCLGKGVVLMLARGRVVKAVVLKTEPRQILLSCVSRVLVKMCDLAMLFGQVATYMKTEGTPAAATI